MLRGIRVVVAFAAVLAFAPCARAQTTWIVNNQGGAGVHFTDLPAAVAAASDGDRILVHADAFGWEYSPFTTSKALAIIGVPNTRGNPLLSTRPSVITGLPAGRSFRLAGFVAQRNDNLRIAVTGCQGPVHLEDLHALEHGFFPTGVPAITITGSAFVTLHDVEDFGDPALSITSSHVVVTACRLGKTSIGLGGGACVSAQASTLVVTEPEFEAIATPGTPAISLTNCQFELGGTSSSYVQGGGGAAGAGAAIHAVGGALVLDPAVQLNPFAAAPQAVTGTAAVTMAPVPAAFITGDTPGGTLTATFTAPAGAIVIGALGLPGLPLSTPLGEQVLRPSPLAVLVVGTAPGSGVVTATMAVPATLPVGPAFGVQSVVFAAGRLELGNGCLFVPH